MGAFLEIAIGSWCITGFVAYAAWCSVRVRLFRDQLFGIRNAMFDAATEAGKLNHPYYVETRIAMNRLIRLAPTISVGTLNLIMREYDAPPPRKGPRLEFADEALWDFSLAIVKYALLWNFSGWFELAKRMLKSMSREAIRHYFKSEAKDVRKAMRSPTMSSVDFLPPELCIA